jgi:LysM repeat protein
VKKKHLKWALLGFFWACLASCQAPGEAEPATSTPTLRPYQTNTATVTASPVTPVADEAEEGLLPTPTPFVHQVQEGETLLSIALRYGVSLDGMLASNPGLDPRFLSIGQELRIPGPEGQPADTLLPTSTPLPLEVSGGRCFLGQDDKWWCIAQVENTNETAVEGLTAQVRFLDDQGERVGSALAYAPLNRLLPGGKLPLLASIEADQTDQLGANFTLLSAVESSGETSRYLTATTEVELDTRLAGGHQWRLGGDVALESEAPEGEYRVSLLAMAVAESGSIVGYTKWEPEDMESSSWSFDILVFSLGPSIDHVELVTEAIELGG